MQGLANVFKATRSRSLVVFDPLVETFASEAGEHFVLPPTVPDYLPSNPVEKIQPSHPAFREADQVVRALAVLSRHLVVLLDHAALVETMHDAYERIALVAEPSGVFLAGPLATADIEGVIIHGAQGARSLSVLIVAPTAQEVKETEMANVFSSVGTRWRSLSCLALLAALGFWLLRPNQTGARPTALAPPSESEVHYVTPRQLTDSSALTATAVPALTATADKGQLFTWPRPDDHRPLVLIFIKKGCPCSVELEPFFHRLERAYADVVRFAGVIDADVPAAQHYAEVNATPYPILADPDRQIIHRFRAENGAYVALVSPYGALARGAGAGDGPAIDSLWPGCSAEMLTQMGQRIAATAGVAERPLDVSGLPSAPITGCPFPR
jgi:hypothetical protein